MRVRDLLTVGAIAAYAFLTTAALAQTLGPVSPSAVGVAAPGQIPGTGTNDNAAAGNVGQYTESVIAAASQIALTTNIPINLTSLSLTAGDWDVNCLPTYFGNTGTVLANVFYSISLTTGTQDSTVGRAILQRYPASFVPAGDTSPGAIGPVRISINATTTVYCVVQAGFTTNNVAVYGSFRARRTR